MKLGDLATIKVGLPLVRKRGDVHNDEYYKYRLVTLKAFSPTGVLLDDGLDEYIANERLNSTYITQEGDILVRLRDPNLAIYIDNQNAGLLVSSLLAIIKPNHEINSRYLTHFINSNHAQKRLKKEVKGTQIPMLKVQDLSDLEIVLPAYEIQDKIVSMLNLANNEIDLLEDLKSLKIQFKNELLDTILQKEINQ